MQALGFHSNARFRYRVATMLEKWRNRKQFPIDTLKLTDQNSFDIIFVTVINN